MSTRKREIEQAGGAGPRAMVPRGPGRGLRQARVSSESQVVVGADVHPRRRLDAAVDAMVAKLVQKLPESTRYAKEQLNFWRALSWSMTIGHLRDWLTVHTGSEEVQEGVRAFVEKREIDYKKLRRRATPSRKR